MPKMPSTVANFRQNRGAVVGWKKSGGGRQSGRRKALRTRLRSVDAARDKRDKFRSEAGYGAPISTQVEDGWCDRLGVVGGNQCVPGLRHTQEKLESAMSKTALNP